MNINRRNLSGLEPHFRMKVERILIDMERYLGYRAYVASGRRTLEQQAAKVREGTSRTLRSKHLCGLAADIVPEGLKRPWQEAPRDFWLKLGYLAYREGLRWGGEFGLSPSMRMKLRQDVQSKRWATKAKLGYDPAHVEANKKCSER